MRLRRISAPALLLWLAPMALVSPRADACGTSGPGGVSACSLAEHREEERPKWRLSVSSLYTNTALDFSGGQRVPETRFASVASLAYLMTRNFSIEFGAGVAYGGHLSASDGLHPFSAGPTFALGASWRVVDGTPFVILSSLISATAATTHLANQSLSTGYQAFDLRLGAMAGITLLDRLSPYLLARAFGGPVYWQVQGQSVTGTDVNHFQIGAGLALLLTKRIDVFVEGVPLGEQAVAAGLSLSL
jgi:hypothetical protein